MYERAVECARACRACRACARRVYAWVRGCERKEENERENEREKGGGAGRASGPEWTPSLCTKPVYTTDGRGVHDRCHSCGTRDQAKPTPIDVLRSVASTALTKKGVYLLDRGRRPPSKSLKVGKRRCVVVVSVPQRHVVAVHERRAEDGVPLRGRRVHSAHEFVGRAGVDQLPVERLVRRRGHPVLCAFNVEPQPGDIDVVVFPVLEQRGNLMCACVLMTVNHS